MIVNDRKEAAGSLVYDAQKKRVTTTKINDFCLYKQVLIFTDYPNAKKR